MGPADRPHPVRSRCYARVVSDPVSPVGGGSQSRCQVQVADAGLDPMERDMARTRRGPTARDLLGSLEYLVMVELWRRFPMSVGDVLERINAVREGPDQLAYTTVMTVLSRLHDKDILAREKMGRSYQYRPRYTEQELVRELGREEVQRMVDRFGGVALAQFATALRDAAPETFEELLELARQDAHD